MSPFVHREDIASVAPLTEPGEGLKLPTTELRGAVVTFRAIPGMTAEWVQRRTSAFPAWTGSSFCASSSGPNQTSRSSW